MKTTLQTYDIARALKQDENANWSWNGATALAEYLDTDENANEEFDFVAIRCDFSEWASLQEWAHDYFGDNYTEQLNIDMEGSCDDRDEIIRQYIQNNGQLIEFDGGIIVSSF